MHNPDKYRGIRLAYLPRRILFANIHGITTLRAFAQSYFLAHCFGTEGDLACIFATLSPRWDYKKGGGESGL